LTATATDVEDGNLRTLVTWTSSRDGFLGTGAQINPRRSARQPTIPPPSPTPAEEPPATLTVIVDAAPTVTITSPAAPHRDRARYSVLAATHTSSRPQRRSAWASSRDSALGTGASLSVSTLTKGSHAVTATVIDAFGRSGVPA
jgi:hypothetical protein